MANYNRRVRRVGRAVYGRGDSDRPGPRSGAKRRLLSYFPGKRVFKSVLWLALLIAVLIIGFQATSIDKVEVQGVSATNSDQVTRSVNMGLRKQWLGGSILLVNGGGLASYIIKSQPIVEEVNIKRKFPHTLLVVVQERQQGIRWKSGEQIYLLDTRGTIIGESSPAHGHLPLIIDSTNLPVKQSDRVVSRAFVAFCSAIFTGVPDLGLKVQEMSIPETTNELNVKTEKGYIIKLDTARPPGEALADLRKINDFLVKNKKVPSEYIDLRIPGKAYYR